MQNVALQEQDTVDRGGHPAVQAEQGEATLEAMKHIYQLRQNPNRNCNPNRDYSLCYLSALSNYSQSTCAALTSTLTLILTLTLTLTLTLGTEAESEKPRKRGRSSIGNALRESKA